MSRDRQRLAELENLKAMTTMINGLLLNYRKKAQICLPGEYWILRKQFFLWILVDAIRDQNADHN